MVVCILFQTSFIAALPGWLSLIPLVVALGVFGIQYFTSPAFILTLLAYGIWVDFLGIGRIDWETISWMVAGAATLLAARWLFSNRSWYGLMACGVACGFTHTVVALILMSLFSWRDDVPMHIAAFLIQSLQELVLLLFFLWILFFLARHSAKTFRRIS